MRVIAVALALAASAACAPAAATTYVFNAALNGANEAPPNASPGSGLGKFIFDTDLHTLLIEVEFEDLIGLTTAAHVHAPTAVAGTGTIGVATELPLFTGFPTGVTAGTYSHTFNMTLASSYNPAFITNFGGGTTAG